MGLLCLGVPINTILLIATETNLTFVSEHTGQVFETCNASAQSLQNDNCMQQVAMWVRDDARHRTQVCIDIDLERVDRS